MPALPPGSTIGILGGGQLARMLALAAARLGLKSHIYAQEADSPAFQVTGAHSVADYRDEKALAAFASQVQAVTYEFENVPVEAVQFLEKLVPVRPGSKALGVAQDRLQEKSLARQLGARTAEFRAVNSSADLKKAVSEVGLPAVLKTTRLGYDGKGQAKIMASGDIEAAWAAMKDQPSILESFVNFEKEISVIAARGADGAFAAYDPVENVHRNHILYTSTVPASLSPAIAAEALAIAKKMTEALDYVGIMGVELFVGDGLYVNEIAPRVHNSGHWTMDACVISQFEQHMRAVAGWPLGSPERHSDVMMTNLLGDEAHDWPRLAARPQTGLHLYGKAEARPGRKMGHFNTLTPRQG
ncbi:5-(carboxyamino)imidazole ribonucleotide synthase [Aestuariivirga litoralis]|uniref:5-(carboxyamino)imidazole ribonucleotide synthase n=1 Tax=Aestuariivirga litoralis TaxID=2650924 RepID=UPI0018C517BE|nr:5-(carboxyamino)imidazole ribonucleotide synthase [Aestuariivirga litoralis]MBG1232467.1 5-(carboxyamino)imidazole ribonucleotide synthase [Aestuariivirga litoralis]